jgi:hypothetical protein
MNEIFRVYHKKFILVFFDDILIYNKLMTNHLQHLKILFELLQSHCLFAKEKPVCFL